MLTNPELMSLDELARRIRALQQATQAATSNALGRADAGDALLAARRRIPAGWGFRGGWHDGYDGGIGP